MQDHKKKRHSKEFLISARLSNPKRLHGGVRFIDAIPKSLSGKILRRTLRDMVKNHKSKL